MVPASEEFPPAPAHAARLGPAAVQGLCAYGRMLASAGVLRGVIGPREVARLWDRHLLNCAAMVEAVPPRVRVADVGAGAGLPGLVLALIRPDLEIVLIEPLQRRCEFLAEALERLRPDARVSVVRGRAEGVPPVGADIVTSRAVAPLDKLVPWCLRHAKIGGCLLAMKGQRAPEELDAVRPMLPRWGAAPDAGILTCGAGWIDPPVQLVRLVRRR